MVQNMNRETNLRAGRIALPVILLLIGAWVQVRAQNPAPQNPVDPAQTQSQTQANQGNQPPDLAFLNLSPEQIQQYLDQLTADRPAGPRKPRRKK